MFYHKAKSRSAVASISLPQGNFVYDDVPKMVKEGTGKLLTIGHDRHPHVTFLP